jgi:hypothetical protein
VKARSARRLHATLTLAWVALLVPGLLFWQESVPFLVFASIYANIAGHWAAYEASNPPTDEDKREAES